MLGRPPGRVTPPDPLTRPSAVAGVTLFDTVDVYGGPQSPDMKKGYGVSEETVGRWLHRGRHRDDIVLATKVYQPMGLGPNDRRLSADHIRRACEASLRRLQTDHIDLYQMHHVDRATPREEIWQAREPSFGRGRACGDKAGEQLPKVPSGQPAMALPQRVGSVPIYRVTPYVTCR